MTDDAMTEAQIEEHTDYLEELPRYARALELAVTARAEGRGTLLVKVRCAAGHDAANVYLMGDNLLVLNQARARRPNSAGRPQIAYWTSNSSGVGKREARPELLDWQWSPAANRARVQGLPAPSYECQQHRPACGDGRHLPSNLSALASEAVARGEVVTTALVAAR